MHLTAVELRKFFQGSAAFFICSAQYGESHKHLIGMKTGIVSAQIGELSMLNRLYHGLGDELHIMIYSCKMLHCIENQCRGRTKEGTLLGSDYRPVGEFDSRGGLAACCCTVAGGLYTFTTPS